MFSTHTLRRLYTDTPHIYLHISRPAQRGVHHRGRLVPRTAPHYIFVLNNLLVPSDQNCCLKRLVVLLCRLGGPLCGHTETLCTSRRVKCNNIIGGVEEHWLEDVVDLGLMLVWQPRISSAWWPGAGICWPAGLGGRAGQWIVKCWKVNSGAGAQAYKPISHSRTTQATSTQILHQFLYSYTRKWHQTWCFSSFTLALPSRP